MKKLILLSFFLGFLSSNIISQEIVRLYKGKAPGSEDWNYKEIELMSPYNSSARSFRNVVDPTLEVFRPEKSKSAGTAVIVCPGGGNYYLEYEKEGTTVAKWLAKNGITAFVLKYRLNKTPEDPKDFQEYQNNMDARMNAPRTGNDSPSRLVQARNYGGEDGIRAVEYVREHATEFNISPDKVGIIGFSAGAGVTMHAVMNSMPGKRPNFAGPIYGGGIRGQEVPEDAPPLFIAGAADDRIAAGAPDLFKAWITAGKTAEIHIYSKGGHGFGLVPQQLPVDTWIERFHEWLTTSGF